jgi:RNA polymerase sigma-54 factor
VTLKDYLTEQINLEINDPTRKLIAFFLLDSLKSNGYINFDSQAASDTLKCSLSLIEEVLFKLQTFDPSGIFARDLKECLKIQLRDVKSSNNKLLLLIDNLELIASNDYKKLTKICQVDNDELKDLIATLKTLNPKPASGFLVETTMFKIPDVILTIDEVGSFKLELNYECVPKLRFNDEFYLKIKSNVKTDSEKDFTKQELSSANNIIKGIDQRVKTILRVANCIVEEQIDFFTRGVMYLKPLTLNKIAEMTGFNESTISRSTANKYISAPNGIYELKYFFSSSLGNTKSAGSNISSTKVKEIIKQLILHEEPDNILSDDDIAVELKKFNIKIARRTVAKYREAAGVATSAYRKRRHNTKY